MSQLGYPADAATARDRVRMMTADQGVFVLVAEQDGNVCGLATLHVIAVLHEDSPRGQLTALVVSEAHRREGVGLALVRHVEAVAAGEGISTLVVTTANHRVDAHEFYDRLGYSWTGRRYAKQL